MTEAPVLDQQALPAGLLLLADGRSPTGGLSHSGGVEQAVNAGLVSDESSLLELLRARLASAGLVAAGLAAAACRGGDLAELDVAADARMPSAAAREASRVQGRGLLRLARSTWPHPAYAGMGPRPHHPLVLGIAVTAAGGTPGHAATLAALNAVSGPASAAVRLLGLDPIAVTGLLARLAPDVEEVAVRARDALPAAGHPVFDLLSERHAARSVTLFSS